MKRLSFLLSIALASPLLQLLAASPDARADLTAPGPVFLPTPVQLTLPPFGEPTSTAGGLAPALAVLPMRLSLLGATFPLASVFPGDPFGCVSREETSGNTRAGFAAQNHAYVPLTSRLVLHGFSSVGCPLDAGIGGGVTYAMPVTRTAWLVAGAGVYGQPSALPGVQRTKSDARLDVVFKTYGPHVLGVGVGKQGLKLTGTW